MRVGAAQRELARAKGARFLHPDIATSITTRGPADSVAPSCLLAPTSGTRVDIIFGGSGKFPHTLQLPDSRQVVRFLDEPEPVKLALSSARYTTALGAVRGSWCLQAHQGSFLVRDIVRNVDESRGAEIAGSADLDAPP